MLTIWKFLKAWFLIQAYKMNKAEDRPGESLGVIGQGDKESMYKLMQEVRLNRSLPHANNWFKMGYGHLSLKMATRRNSCRLRSSLL